MKMLLFLCFIIKIINADLLTYKRVCLSMHFAFHHKKSAFKTAEIARYVEGAVCEMADRGFLVGFRSEGFDISDMSRKGRRMNLWFGFSTSHVLGMMQREGKQVSHVPARKTNTSLISSV